MAVKVLEAGAIAAGGERNAFRTTEGLTPFEIEGGEESSAGFGFSAQALEDFVAEASVRTCTMSGSFGVLAVVIVLNSVFCFM